MSWGTHFCLFYETKEDLLGFFIPFFKAGLEHREFCLCVASEPLIAEEAELVMRQALPNFDHYLAEGQIEITSHTDWYLKEGHFDEGRVLQGWIDKLDHALAKGFSGIRFAANILLEKSDWESFARYEGRLEETLRDLRIEGLCAYNLNRYSAANALDVIHHHQFTLARRDGAWEPLEGVKLKDAHEEVLKLNADLERRVQERSSQLEAVNEQLTREVAERKEAEARLHAQEREYRTIVENVPDQIIRYDRNLRRIYVNPAVTQDYDIPKEVFIGKPIGSIVTDAQLVVDNEEVDAQRRRIQTVFDTGKPTESEVTWPLPGGRRTYSSRLFPEFDPNGEVISVLGIARDITKRKQAEDELRSQKEILQKIFDHTPVMIGIIGVDGQWKMINRAWERTLGWTLEELQQPNFDVLAEVYPDPGEHQRVMDFVAAKSGKWEEFKARARDGRMLDVTFTNVHLSDGTTLGFGLEITERKQAEERLRKSERVLREAEVLGHTGSWEQDLITGEIFNTEENLRLFFGDDRSKGEDFEDYAQTVHPEDREYVMQRRVELLEEEGPSDIEYRVVWPDGSVHVIFGRATVVRNELGQPIRVYGTNVDITERKQREEDIRHYAARMEALAEISQALAEVGLDVREVFETIVRQTAELIGDTCVIRLLSRDEQWLNSVTFHNPNPEVKALMRLFHPTPTSANDSWLTPVLQTGQPLLIPVITQEQVRQSVQPEYLPFFEQVGLHSMLIVPLRVKGRVIGTMGLSRDNPGHPYTLDDQVLLQDLADRASLTIQNAQLFEQVEGAGEQLGALSRRLLEVQESERRALTTELHDRVGQSLTGLSILLQNIKALLADETAQELATKFHDAQSLVQETTRQIRDIMAELHLPELEDYGLAAALETYAERVASRGNLELIADLPDLAPPPLHSNVRIALFRAAQEAISNVLKHANASQLQVSLEERNNRITLTIEDNGKGFEPETASQKESPTWGWKIMRERVESIGGKVQIESEPGAGTRVAFEVERPS